MSPKPPSPRRVAAAVRAVGTGRSLRDVADEYGVSFVTVSRWVAASKVKQGSAPAPKADPKKATKKSAPPWAGLTSALAQRNAPEAEAEAEEPGAEAEAEAGSLLDQVKALQRNMLATARAAKGVGNMKAAQAALASAGLLANTIARISKTEAEGADVLKISKHEVQTVADGLRERIAVMRARPLLCAHCSRQLSIDWAYEGREKPDVIVAFEAEDLAGSGPNAAAVTRSP